MRITFILPYAGLTGGIRVVGIYAERLQKRGHQVTIISCPATQPSAKQRLKAILKGVLKGRIVPVWKKRGASHLDGIDVPHRIIDRYRPVTDADVPDADVVIATWWETAEWVANLSASKGAKAYFLQHYEIFEYLPKDRVMATWRLPMHKITISQWLVDLAKNTYGDNDVSLVPNSVDTEQFYAPPRSRQEVPTVGLLYSGIYWKGCDVSLKAISLAAPEIPGLRVVAFGFEEAPLPHLPLPAGSSYEHQPRQSRIREIYSLCDIWLCGSWSEGFHLPPLEAMACRCPVVSTFVGGSMDVIEDGVNGYLVPTGDSDALAKRIVEIFRLDGKQWQTMSDAAYATATRYSWDDATVRFEAALCRCVGAPR